MTILEWNGEIGWDLWPERVQSELSMAGGDDIEINFSSPGGNIMQGGDIYLSLVRYRRSFPNAKMVLNIKSVAASYGSLIASSPVWSEVTVESISMAMYHNPSNIVFGDFRAMEENAVFLKDSRDMYVDIYSNRSGMEDTETEEMMDKETWFLGGQAIVDAGFADRVLESEPNPAMSISMYAEKAKMSFKESRKRMADLAESGQSGFDYEKAVACMSAITGKIPEVKPAKPGKPDDIKKPAPVGNLKTEVPMNEAELKKDNPELYASLMKKGADDERDNNNARVKALTEMKAKDEYKDLPEVVMVIDKAIEDGTTPEAVNPLIMAAMMKIMKDPARMASIESPGDISGGDGDQTTTTAKTVAEV